MFILHYFYTLMFIYNNVQDMSQTPDWKTENPASTTG